jgi:adenylylsulfate kinase
MLVVMTGLPATGKSTVAKALAAHIDAVTVNKDDVRRAAFAPEVLDYSGAQNDLCMEMVYGAVGYIVRKWPGRNVIIDGRTYARKAQRERLIAFASGLDIEPEFIECTCSDETARLRLEAASCEHAARDRTYARYLALKSESDPLEVRRLSLDTGAVDVQRAARLCVAYLSDRFPA